MKPSENWQGVALAVLVASGGRVDTGGLRASQWWGLRTLAGFRVRTPMWACCLAGAKSDNNIQAQSTAQRTNAFS